MSNELPLLSQAYSSNTHHARVRGTGLFHGLRIMSTLPMVLMAFENVPTHHSNGFAQVSCWQLLNKSNHTKESQEALWPPEK